MHDRSRRFRLQRCCRTIPQSHCDRGSRKRRIAPRRNCSLSSDRNNRSRPALSSINSALDDNMKKIALITASLAMLASPAFAQEAKTVGTAPAEAKFSTVSKDEMFSSKLKGLNVYNQKEESVGEITDL